MLPSGRAGIAVLDPAGGGGFAPVTERALGNQVPGWTGSHGDTPNKPGPHPAGQPLGGNVGNFDGYSGADPAAPKIQPHPHVSVLGEGQESFRQQGIIGFNDRLQVRDRHAYWDRGSQRTGITPSVPGNPPNNHTAGPARPDLRTVNISVNPQIGSDNSRNQDDLTRAYTWLGQQDGSVQPIYGGVPGLYQPYGTRGGVPYAIVDPTNGEGGPEDVYSGPPHGLHSNTLPSGKQIADRYKATPQMRPVRVDRPDNSKVAGQSYSQTVLAQGAQQQAVQGGSGLRASVGLRLGARGWGGQ